MIDFLPPVLMGEARQQQQVVLCWDTRTTQPCTPLVTGVVWEGSVHGEEGHEGVLLRRNQPSPISTSLTLINGGACHVVYQILTEIAT